MIEVLLLGPVVALSDGEPLPVPRTLERALLSRLALEPGRTVIADRLVDDLWGEEPPRNGLASLQGLVYRLRQTLGPSASAVSWAEGGYRLEVGAEGVDVARFERCLVEARRCQDVSDPGGASDALRAALDLWRGAPFAGLESVPFVAAQITRLGEARLGALEQRIELDLAAGRHRELVAELEGLVAEHPYHERLWGQLMLALYRSGAQAAALRCYSRLRTLLAEGLGIEPGPEVRALEQSVLRQDPALDWHEPEPRSEGQLAARQSAASGAATAPAAPAAEHAPGWAPDTVTLLYAEVDAAARWWDVSPEEMAEVSSSQRRIVGLAGERRGGRSLRQSGDAACVRFERASDAVAAALDAQRELGRMAPGRAGRIAVRMSVHTGEVEELGDTAFGPAMHRAARLSEAAHGGQVLCSATTAELVRDRLPDGARLLDLGIWSFPDLDRPERVHQLLHPDLPAAFPRLRRGRPETGTLPLIGTSFHGRGRDVIALADDLRDAVLVTVVGEGGVGKTRLAIEAARDVAGQFAEGVRWCDLSAVTEPEEVTEQLAVAVGVGGVPGADIASELVEVLRFSEVLVVIDNCEHVTDAVASLLGRVLAATPAGRFLATSRVPTGCAGERVVRLGPLPVRSEDPAPDTAGQGRPHTAGEGRPDAAGQRRPGPAVLLLSDRGVEAGAHLRPDDDALVEIAEKLDGNPLALELAGRRLASMTAAELAARLDQRFDLLVARSAPQRRQQSLRAAVDWSYELLDAQERALFAGLSVFAGGWALPAAEHVAPAAGVPPGATARLVADLTDKSLVTHGLSSEGAARYWMLETLRSYAAEKLAATGQAKAVGDAHAEYFVGLAQRAATAAHGAQEGWWAAQLDQDLGNLRAAFRWCLTSAAWDAAGGLLGALVDELVLRERLEVGRWAAELLAEPGVEGHWAQAVALSLAGYVALLEGRIVEAESLSRRALGVESSTGASPLWLSRNTLALVAAVDRPAETEDLLAAMIDASAVSHDPMGAAVALFDRALLASFRGRPEEGVGPAKELVELGRRHECPSIIAMGLLSVGRSLGSGVPEQALPSLHEGFDLAASAHSSLLAREIRRALVETYARRGDRARSLALLGELLDDFGRSGDRSQQLQTVLATLEILVELDALALAATICGAFSRTPLGATAQCRVVTGVVAERMAPDQYASCYERGAAMTPGELVSMTLTELAKLIEG